MIFENRFHFQNWVGVLELSRPTDNTPKNNLDEVAMMAAVAKMGLDRVRP